MFVHGVFFDVALNPLFRGCWQPLDQWGTSFAVRLFSSDDTPTLTNDPNSFAELNNGTYEPFIVTLSSQSGHFIPPPPYWSVFGAKFTLAPPSVDNGTIYGWYGGPLDDSEGNTYQIAGGRFDPPIVIPPAGMTLTIDELRIYLHDCSYPPPPPPVAGGGFVKDPSFELPNIGASSFEYGPLGGDWFFNPTDGSHGGAGIAGTTSAFLPPPVLGAITQVGLLQDTLGMCSQSLALPAGNYRVSATVAERSPGGGQSLSVTWGGVGIDTIPAGLPTWQPWLSDTFTVASDATAPFVLQTLVAGDHTMFIARITVIPGLP